MTNPTDIARRSYQAYVDKDREAIEAVIAEDFHFTSPLDNRIDRRTYFERCWPGSERISDFRFIRLVEDGEQVFVTYEGTWTSGRRFRNTEVLTVRDGKIVEAEVYFGWNIPHAAPEGGFADTTKTGGGPMPLSRIFAHLSCSNLPTSRTWFEKLFGRAPDAHPMNGLAEWHHGGNAGLQLFENAQHAGRGTLTLIVEGLSGERERLEKAGLEPGEIEPATSARLVRLHDPDGNLVVMAEPEQA